MIGLLRRRGIDDIMQPAEPVWRNLAGLGEALVNHPTARAPRRTLSARVLVIAIAVFVLSDKLAACVRVQPRRKRRAMPPREEIADQAHSRPQFLSRLRQTEPSVHPHDRRAPDNSRYGWPRKSL